MTVEEKREFIKAYCLKHTCSRCSVDTIAKARGEVRANGLPECWSSHRLTEEMLDARIEVIQAEQGSVGTPVEEFVCREGKIAALDEHCDGTTCSDCPCNIDSLKKYCVDGHTCDFDEMSDEGLNAYLDTISSHKSTVAADDEARESVVATAVKAIAALRNTEISDNVNHPQHYELPGGIECFDVLLATQGERDVQAFCICNAIKYLFRHRRKNGLEDVKKAKWYIDKFIELEEEQRHD